MQTGEKSRLYARVQDRRFVSTIARIRVLLWRSTKVSSSRASWIRRARARSSVADQMAPARSTALSRFHPATPLPMDHGYTVDVAHLLFTASADSHDTQRRRRRTASARRTMGFAPRLRGETIAECTYNRNRVSPNRARGWKKAYSLDWP